VHVGNRPSSLLLFERLDPATLGKVVALYEHKVFVESVLWDINAFDQWGVELGKQVADRLTPAVRGQSVATEPSVAAILARLARWNQ
jgi:glucose-6-phosphate isomerase